MYDPKSAIAAYTALIEERAIQVRDEVYRDIANSLLPRLETDVRNAYYDAADEWYSAYMPRYYKREGKPAFHNGGLFDIMDTELDTSNYYVGWTFKGDELTGRSNGNGTRQNLFTKVFVQGWHGGAYDSQTGRMRYRKPLYIWSEWGRNAVRTGSPYKLFTKKKEMLERLYQAELYDMVEKGFFQKWQEIGW